jgi:FdrA protein
MIDTEARTEYLLRQAKDPTVAVVLLDVVIGDGAHEDPASLLAPVTAEVVRSGVAVVVYVLGTARDPQGFEAQRAAFRRAGCIVTETAARAALAAAALVLRDPTIVTADLSASPTSHPNTATRSKRSR